MQLFARQPQTSSQALVEYIPHETFAKSFLEAWFQDDHEKRTPGSKVSSTYDVILLSYPPRQYL